MARKPIAVANVDKSVMISTMAEVLKDRSGDLINAIEYETAAIHHRKMCQAAYDEARSVFKAAYAEIITGTDVFSDA